MLGSVSTKKLACEGGSAELAVVVNNPEVTNFERRDDIRW
jgi:hypothetical protein